MLQQAQVKKLSSTLDTLIEVFSYMLEDLRYFSNSKNPLYYNVDFSIMFPYLFPTNPDTASDFLVSGKQIFETLLKIKTAKVPFRLAFSGASFWELVDLINHNFQFWRNRSQARATIQDDIDSLKSKINPREVSFEDATNILVDSGYPKRYLEAISTEGFSQHVETPLLKAKKLFKDGDLFSSLGDKVTGTPKFYSSYKDKYSAFLTKMLEGRYDRSTRSPADREFHYSVDTANWALCVTNNKENEMKFLYATPVKYIMDKSQDGLNCRSPLVPAYLINSNLLLQKGLFRDEEHYINNGFLLAINLKKSLDATKGDISKFTSYEIEELRLLNEYYLKPLNSTDVQSTDTGVIKTKEDILNLLDLGSKKLTEAAENAKSNILASAGEVISCALDTMNEELVRTIDLHKNKIIKKIANNLKIKI